jgi:peroxiredoxin
LAKLREAGGVEAVYLNRLQFQLGEKDAAEKAARDLASSGTNQVLPLAALVDLLWQNGKKEEATKKFEELRKLAGAADLDAPPLVRLDPIAKDLTWPDDWRTPNPPAADVGVRPPLDSLGPFRWQPYVAANWTLPATDGAPKSLESYRGRPVVVIFFLGSGCLHCVEQLQAFAPKAEEFKAAGIDLVAISMDDQDGLKKSLASYKPGVLPIPLLADPQLTAFKAYGCYDDFEKKTLHGTFFIDPTGHVRWQDIAYEPFMDASFVLGEAKRLLAQTAAATPAAPPATTAPLSAK